MANDLDLKIRISAQLGELRKALDTVQKELDDTGAAGKKAGKEASQGLDKLQGELRQTEVAAKKAGKATAEGFSGLERTVSRATAAITGFLSVYTAITAVKGVAGLTDEYARFNAQLKLATGSAEEFAAAQQGVFKIAQETRAPVQDVANTYATLSRSTKTLGVSQEELLAVLGTVNRAIALTPVSAETARATLTQFGQALSGDFKAGAQEINSILEQTPGLANAIAQGLGVAVGDLKRMGEEGELSAEKVFRALQSMGSEIEAQFSEIPLTVGGAITQLQNDVLMTFGTADTQPLIDAIGDLRETLTDPAVVQGLLNLANGLTRVASAAVEATGAIGGFAAWVGEELAARLNGIAGDDLVRLSDRIVELTDDIATLEDSVFASTPRYQEKIAQLKGELAETQRLYDGAVKAQDEAAVAASRKAQADAEAKKKIEEKGEADLKAAAAANEQKKADEEAAKAAAARQKQIDSFLANLQEQADTYGKSAEEVVRYQLALLGATKAEQDRAGALAAQVEALKKQEEANKDAAKQAEERKRAEEKLAKDLDDIRIRSLEASGRTFEARAAQLEQQYRPIIDQLKEAGDEGGVELVNNLVNLELAQARLDELGKIGSEALEKLRQAEQSVASRVQSGDISAAQGRQELQGARGEATSTLTAMRADLQLLADQDVPGAQQALLNLDTTLQQINAQGASGFERSLLQMRASLDQLKEDFAGQALENFTSGFGDAIADIVTGAKTGEEAMRDLARGFIASLARMAAEALAKKVILSLFGVPTFHTGGIVTGGRRASRAISPLAFAGAPRYHSGGIAGLKPGEVPAILQQGEEVLTKNDPRHSLNGGQQGGGGNVRIINTLDPGMVADYLSTAAGEKVILNVIQRNSGAVKQSIN